MTTPEQAIAWLTTNAVCRPADSSPDLEQVYSVSSLTSTTLDFQCINQVRPQVESITPDVDLVLFTMGGNDVGFTSIVSGCFVFASESQCKSAVEAAKRKAPAMGEALLDGVAAMRAHGLRSDARIVQLGYPYLQVDNDYTLGAYPAGDEVRSLSDIGNTVIGDVVRRANLSNPGQMIGIDTVTDYFAGHEPNARGGNPQRWVHQLTNPLADSYHPNPLGHRAYADLLVAGGDLTRVTLPKVHLRVSPLVSSAPAGSSIPLDVRVRTTNRTPAQGLIVVRLASTGEELASARLTRADNGRRVIDVTGLPAGRHTFAVDYVDRSGVTRTVTTGAVRVSP